MSARTPWTKDDPIHFDTDNPPAPITSTDREPGGSARVGDVDSFDSFNLCGLTRDSLAIDIFPPVPIGAVPRTPPSEDFALPGLPWTIDDAIHFDADNPPALITSTDRELGGSASFGDVDSFDSFNLCGLTRDPMEPLAPFTTENLVLPGLKLY